MTPTIEKAHYFAVFYSIVLAGLSHYAAGECTFPSYFTGEWFSMEQGRNILITVTEYRWGNLDCLEALYHDQTVPSALGQNATYLLSNPDEPGCYFCQNVLWRTPNVLQVLRGINICTTERQELATICQPLEQLTFEDNDLLTTYFKADDATSINCASTFEGVDQFTYEHNFGGGGICDNPGNVIKACQDPGSPYVENEVFWMNFRKCNDVDTSYNKEVQYQCYGTWDFTSGRIGTVFTLAAIADTAERDLRERFKCLLTDKNQRRYQNKTRWVMSRFARCSRLNSIGYGPVNLALTKKNVGCPSWAGGNVNP